MTEFMGAPGCEALALGQGQRLVEFHCSPAAISAAEVARPRPPGDGSNRRPKRGLHEVVREAVPRKLVVVVRERFQAPHERSKRAIFALTIDDAVRVPAQLLKQNAVPGVRKFVELGAFAPGGNFQLHAVGQFAQLVDVVV